MIHIGEQMMTHLEYVYLVNDDKPYNILLKRYGMFDDINSILHWYILMSFNA